MKAIGTSTPSQTAWGLIGLLAAAEPNDAAIARAVQFLVECQSADGFWDESAFTGTGFPSVFYLRYHLYRDAFPLYALARYRNVVKNNKPFCGVLVSPQQFERRNGSRASR
jgi:squalene-hopene/tetraprenyl-beta-curcumene cyclase